MLCDDIVINGGRAMARSYAKINLTLDVLGRRRDGYHDVEMIMQTLSLYDLIIADKCADRISVSTNLKYLPAGEKNIAHKAAKAFKEYTGVRGGVKIMIHKNIPVAAGLAGGSGNAAAVLCAMDMLYDTHLGTRRLCEIGARLGADVPFCVRGGTMLAQGIGDTLTELSPMPAANFLLVKPNINVATKDIYEEMDKARILKRPDTARMRAALERGDIRAVAGNLCNVMESVTARMYPEIAGIKKKMMMNGALGAVMSGSGPTVFGIFDNYRTAKASADSFAYQYKEVYLVREYN